MKNKTQTPISLGQLTHLPAFAAYLLNERLDDFLAVQLRVSEEVDLPILQFFKNLPPKELDTITRKGAIEFLSALARNEADKQIAQSVRNWKENQLPVIQKYEVVAEDVTLMSYMRKQTFLHFIEEYNPDMKTALELVREIDFYLMSSETVMANTFIQLLREKISEHSFFIEKVNETIPGAVYVFDLDEFKGVYSNNKLPDVIGYTHAELNDLGKHALNTLIHPEDLASVNSQLEVLRNARDGETHAIKYRIRDRYGEYRWISNHESVFKRTPEGKVSQTIGITLDVDQEQKISEALRENESLYRQAEAITHLGNYTWNVKTGAMKWSDELYRIYGFEPGGVELNDVRRFNHPDDDHIVDEALRQLMEEGKPFDFDYRIVLSDGTEKFLHARGNLLPDPSGTPSTILGTVQDLTETRNLINRLRHSESVYKQAEVLANMGNWTWELATGKLEWTDQLFRIYGLEPQSEQLTLERFLSFVHPEDHEYVKGGTGDEFTDDLLDYTFRIITQDGKTKILHSVARVLRDESGKALRIVGTERDITEKQNLIDKLRKSESLYKQAQSLAHVGNWSWDMSRNNIQWSDELFRIYGLEPQARVLNYEEYLTYIHPDDLERVSRQIDAAARTGESWEYTHRIRRDNGEVRVLNATGEVLLDEKGRPYMMVGTAQDVTDRQALIDRLQESEKLSRQAQSLACLGSWTLNVQTGAFAWSDEMYNIYEIDRNETMDIDKWLYFLPAEDREELLAYYRQCLSERKSYDRVHRVHLRNGKAKTIHRKGEFIFDKHGEPVKMIGTTQDITEEYRVQQELKDNQTFIRKIADATPSIIASYNVNTGKYVFISEGLEKLLGYHRSDVMENGLQFFTGIIHPDDITELMERNRQALEEANSGPQPTDLVLEFTYRMRHRSGHYRWFHTYGTIFDRNAEGHVEHVLNISLDVTDQMTALEKIREQEHFIQQIADASPTILYLYNVETQSIQYINREIFFVLGYLPEEIIDAGASITSTLYHPDDHHLLPGRVQSHKTFQQVDSMIQYECRMRNKEGDWRWLLVREIVFKTDDKGNILQILGAALDINRRKDMEKTILQNTLLLEQSNASLEEFAYVASHDLKEPLRKISTFGDRLVAMQTDALAPEGKIYLKKIVDASQRMQTMISDLLSISMITGNTSFEQHSLQAIFEETLQTLEFKIEQLNAHITADPLPQANIIPSQIRQLFQNLLSNSLKFVRAGAQPEIRISYSLLAAQDMVHYQLAQSTHYHRLQFADNGIGFENEFAGKIFAIFQRLHGRSEYEGSGIGLAICKKIVEHHGGIIYATGVPGEGATFIIILPA